LALRNGADGTNAGAANWNRLRTFSMLSIALWIATFLAGSILTNVS
jgi:hypothetical protein